MLRSVLVCLVLIATIGVAEARYSERIHGKKLSKRTSHSSRQHPQPQPEAAEYPNVLEEDAGAGDSAAPTSGESWMDMGKNIIGEVAGAVGFTAPQDPPALVPFPSANNNNKHRHQVQNARSFNFDDEESLSAPKSGGWFGGLMGNSEQPQQSLEEEQGSVSDMDQLAQNAQSVPTEASTGWMGSLFSAATGAATHAATAHPRFTAPQPQPAGNGGFLDSWLGGNVNDKSEVQHVLALKGQMPQFNVQESAESSAMNKMPDFADEEMPQDYPQAEDDFDDSNNAY